MKRVLLLSAVLTLSVLTFAQRTNVPNDIKNWAVERVAPTLETMNLSHEVALPSNPSMLPPEATTVGTTWYDLQSNTSMQNRVHVYPDGTAAAVWTFGEDHPGFAGDRGTGYNYYDGSSWGEYPTERIESVRCGWPAYAPFGENGEIVVTHSGNIDNGLMFNKRDEKGTGEWTEFSFVGPSGHDLLWPRMTTGGVNNSVIHLVAITTPEGNGGTLYEGLDGAILYSRSSDGGDTWDVENELLDGMGSDIYASWDGDTYSIQVQGDNVAILAGDSWRDLILMKSTDGGDTWVKTTIWDNLYKDWTTGTVTDTFYCADGAKHMTFDETGKVHVAFGINRALSVDGTAQSWFPGVGGIAYWNEDRDTFSNDKNALCPFSDCVYSELVEDYSLIGWTQDTDPDKEINYETIALYYIGLSSMPQIHVDGDKIFVGYTSVTDAYDDGDQNFRKVWMRTSNGGGEAGTWGEFHHLTADLSYIFKETVWLSMASYSDDYLYYTFQSDPLPGLAVRGDEDPYGENEIHFIKLLKSEVVTTGVEETNTVISQNDVSQNYPNPFNNTSVVTVTLKEKSNLSMEVMNITGQTVYNVEVANAAIGANKLTIDGSKLSAGVYFYTVKAGNSSVTKKMIVE